MAIVTVCQRAANPKKLDPYPVEILKRADRPTTQINDNEVKRVDERESGFNRCYRGDFGPFIQHEVSRFVQWNMCNIPFARRFAVWGDDLFGYGKPKPEYKWWFDLEDVDGVLRVPTCSSERGNNKLSPKKWK